VPAGQNGGRIKKEGKESKTVGSLGGPRRVNGSLWYVRVRELEQKVVGGTISVQKGPLKMKNVGELRDCATRKVAVETRNG